MESVASGSRLEESVVGIEHFFGEKLEPLPGDASGIFSFFIFELNFEFALENLWFVVHDFCKSILEDIFATELHVHHVVF